MDISRIAKQHRIPESDELAVLADIVEQAIGEALPAELRNDIAELRSDLAKLRQEHVTKPRRHQHFRWCASGIVALVCSMIVLTAQWGVHAPLIAVCVLVGLLAFMAVFMAMS